MGRGMGRMLIALLIPAAARTFLRIEEIALPCLGSAVRMMAVKASKPEGGREESSPELAVTKSEMEDCQRGTQPRDRLTPPSSKGPEDALTDDD